jgi:hypothetical protein
LLIPSQFTLVLDTLLKDLMSNGIEATHQIGYLKGKCEIYERFLPQLMESVMNVAYMYMQSQGRQDRNSGGLSSMFNSPDMQDLFKEYIKQRIKTWIEAQTPDVPKPSI